MAETLVIALGGNVITRSGESCTIPRQFEHTAGTVEHLRPLSLGSRQPAATHIVAGEI